MSPSALISADTVSFRYPAQARAVGPFSFEARAGEFHLVSGASGCGKSTLARVLCGLIPHLYRGRLDGHVRIAGRRSEQIPLWELSTLIGFVSQNPAAQLLASTVEDEIVFGLENLGLHAKDIEARVDAVLTSFSLQRLARRDPRTLSGGEQQQLILAAMTARQPHVLVLDEPLSMLDTAAAAMTVAHLERLRRDGMAVVTFEHRAAFFEPLHRLTRLELPGDQLAEGPLPDVPQRVPAFRLIAEGVGVELSGPPVLQGIDLALSGGQVVAVVGANGAGKTTLLRVVAGLQAHSGRLTGSIDGCARQPRVGLCFQNPDRQIFNPTVRDEILFGLAEHDEGVYRSILTLLGLAAYEDTRPLLLSEGEKKRLALATLLIRPGLCGVCLDEPTLGQDARHRRLLGRIVKRLAAAGYLCLIATHDLAWAAEWADQLLMLHAGRLVAAGTPPSVLGRQTWHRAGLLLPNNLVTRCDLEHQALQQAAKRRLGDPSTGSG